MTADSADPAQVLAAWGAAGGALQTLGAGHINDTWLAVTRAGPFVLQRINPRVFPDPQAVAAKVAAVEAHLRPQTGVRVPRLLPTVAGQPWHCDPEGGVWRLWEHVAPSRTLQRLDNVAQAEAAGAAFGRLQQALADLPLDLPDPIPGFMRLGRYLQALDEAAARAPLPADAAGALAEVAPRRSLAGLFQARSQVVHGDCKVNNLLFAPAKDAVLCIIDLDTVMKGHWAWDLGDLVRSAADGAGGFSLSRYGAVVRGFVGSGAGDGDREALVLAPRYVTFMLAVRFLTDHLEGDRYFKVSARGENLRRATLQLELLAAMEAQEADMGRVAAGA